MCGVMQSDDYPSRLLTEGEQYKKRVDAHTRMHEPLQQAATNTPLPSTRRQHRMHVIASFVRMPAFRGERNYDCD
jgi:hypothetical protein